MRERISHKIVLQKQLLSEHEEHCKQNKYEGHQVIPFKRLAQVKNWEESEYNKRDTFLNDLKLCRRKGAMSEPVGRNHKTVFEESDQPAHQYYLPQSNIFKAQMTIPGKGHEDIGDN